MVRTPLGWALILGALALGGCGGAGFTPTAEVGRIAGTLTVVGPLNRNIDVSLAVVRANTELPLKKADFGPLITQTGEEPHGRLLEFNFTGLPLAKHNIVLRGRSGDQTTVYYRSGELSLSVEQPEISDFSGEMSFSGPPPWGSVSGTILLNGANPGVADLTLFVQSEGRPSLKYHFDVWNADFGVLYYAVGGLAQGSYRLGLYEPLSFSLLGDLSAPVAVRANGDDPAGVLLVGEYYNIPPTGEVFVLAGEVAFSAAPPAEGFVALIAREQDHPALGTSPIQHLPPASVGGDGRAEFYLANLPAGTYELAVYALDFVNGEHVVLGALAEPLALGPEHPLILDLEVPADVGLIP